MWNVKICKDNYFHIIIKTNKNINNFVLWLIKKLFVSRHVLRLNFSNEENIIGPYYKK